MKHGSGHEYGGAYAGGNVIPGEVVDISDDARKPDVTAENGGPAGIDAGTADVDTTGNTEQVVSGGEENTADTQTESRNKGLGRISRIRDRWKSRSSAAEYASEMGLGAIETGAENTRKVARYIGRKTVEAVGGCITFLENTQVKGRAAKGIVDEKMKDYGGKIDTGVTGAIDIVGGFVDDIPTKIADAKKGYIEKREAAKRRKQERQDTYIKLQQERLEKNAQRKAIKNRIEEIQRASAAEISALQRQLAEIK